MALADALDFADGTLIEVGLLEGEGLMLGGVVSHYDINRQAGAGGWQQ
jgi:hypothetical protein